MPTRDEMLAAGYPEDELDAELRKEHRIEESDWPDNPAWEYVRCECHHGLVGNMASPYPEECGTCMGSGYIVKHKKTGTLAKYPGGPFVGRESNNQ